MVQILITRKSAVEFMKTKADDTCRKIMEVLLRAVLMTPVLDLMIVTHGTVTSTTLSLTVALTDKFLNHPAAVAHKMLEGLY